MPVRSRSPALIVSALTPGGFRVFERGSALRQRAAHLPAPARHRAHPPRRPPARRNRRGEPYHRRHHPGRALLLAGRIEFFDLRLPDDADATFVRALQAAGEADDTLLGSASLAHAAFAPGWAGRGDEYADGMRAARTYARRAPASAEFLAWLDAVEAECETISGHPREALRLIEHAESVLAAGNDHASPDWFTWFSPVRLAAFKGNAQLKAGHLPQAQETLTAALTNATTADDKQRTVILGDLAAVEAAQHDPEAACGYAEQALQQLASAGRTPGPAWTHPSHRTWRSCPPDSPALEGWHPPGPSGSPRYRPTGHRSGAGSRRRPALPAPGSGLGGPARRARAGPVFGAPQI